MVSVRLFGEGNGEGGEEREMGKVLTGPAEISVSRVSISCFCAAGFGAAV